MRVQTLLKSRPISTTALTARLRGVWWPGMLYRLVKLDPESTRDTRLPWWMHLPLVTADASGSNSFRILIARLVLDRLQGSTGGPALTRKCRCSKAPQSLLRVPGQSQRCPAKQLPLRACGLRRGRRWSGRPLPWHRIKLCHFNFVSYQHGPKRPAAWAHKAGELL